MEAIACADGQLVGGVALVLLEVRLRIYGPTISASCQDTALACECHAGPSYRHATHKVEVAQAAPRDATLTALAARPEA
eukprot:8506819-Pyramimonas_sp.AAC.1